jgi:2,4-dienoyl-CoA reductase-like NADH-dependent reductase (Old Yellow Enzyme family)
MAYPRWDDHADGRPARSVGCTAGAHHDSNDPDVDLLCPLEIRGVSLKNRIVVSPMCQYSARDGLADDWHLVHLGSRAVGGAGLIFTEATAVVPEGRISPGDLGLWNDEQIEPLARIVSFLKRMGSVPGIQLAHAGRKGSCQVPWEGGRRIAAKDGGWQVVAPSPIPFVESDPPPRALDEAGVQHVIGSFVAATRRALRAGFEILEIHSAHGYLLHEFLSPLSNHRTDAYGGSLENRMRLLLEVAAAMRLVMPADMPLFVRISATDWVEGGWDLDQSVALAKALKPPGVDLIDVSSGALVPLARIPVGRNFQVPFAAAIRQAAGISTGAVGLITDPEQADELITSGACDLVFLAREMLREPYWALKAQQALGQEPDWPLPYGYAVRRPKRDVPRTAAQKLEGA